MTSDSAPPSPPDRKDVSEDKSGWILTKLRNIVLSVALAAGFGGFTARDTLDPYYDSPRQPPAVRVVCESPSQSVFDAFRETSNEIMGVLRQVKDGEMSPDDGVQQIVNILQERRVSLTQEQIDELKQIAIKAGGKVADSILKSMVKDFLMRQLTGTGTTPTPSPTPAASPRPK
jgi:hypothetical protein